MAASATRPKLTHSSLRAAVEPHWPVRQFAPHAAQCCPLPYRMRLAASSAMDRANQDSKNRKSMSVVKSLLAAFVVIAIPSACTMLTPAPHVEVWEDFIAGPSADSSKQIHGQMVASSAGIRILERDVLGRGGPSPKT